MNVIVIRKHVFEDDQDIEFLMIAHPESGPMISPVMRLEGKAPFANRNPYCVYGDAVAGFTGKSKSDCSITVAECTSGDLRHWVTRI